MYLKDDYLLVESTTTDGGCSKDVHVLNKQSLEILEILQDATILAYIIHSGFISGYQNRYGDNLKPPTNVYHRMTA